MTDDKMPLTAHLTELRTRLVISMAAIVAGSIGSYIFAERIFAFLAAPLIKNLPEDSHLIFTGVAEGFFTYLKTALYSGVFFAMPVVLFEIWLFISPGLYKKEKRYGLPFIFFSTLFFVGGAAFGYFIVFPFGFQFFLGFETDAIHPLPSIKEYLSFTVKLIMAFGLIFELPLFTFFLARMGIVTGKFMASQRRYAILLIFVISAAITPPDPLTQIMMAGPLIVLYELSVIVARVFGRKRDEEDVEEEEETPEDDGNDEGPDEELAG